MPNKLLHITPPQPSFPDTITPVTFDECFKKFLDSLTITLTSFFGMVALFPQDANCADSVIRDVIWNCIRDLAKVHDVIRGLGYPALADILERAGRLIAHHGPKNEHHNRNGLNAETRGTLAEIDILGLPATIPPGSDSFTRAQDAIVCQVAQFLATHGNSEGVLSLRTGTSGSSTASAVVTAPETSFQTRNPAHNPFPTPPAHPALNHPITGLPSPQIQIPGRNPSSPLNLCEPAPPSLDRSVARISSPQAQMPPRRVFPLPPSNPAFPALDRSLSRPSFSQARCTGHNPSSPHIHRQPARLGLDCPLERVSKSQAHGPVHRASPFLPIRRQPTLSHRQPTPRNLGGYIAGPSPPQPRPGCKPTSPPMLLQPASFFDSDEIFGLTLGHFLLARQNNDNKLNINPPIPGPKPEPKPEGSEEPVKQPVKIQCMTPAQAKYRQAWLISQRGKRNAARAPPRSRRRPLPGPSPLSGTTRSTSSTVPPLNSHDTAHGRPRSSILGLPDDLLWYSPTRADISPSHSSQHPTKISLPPAPYDTTGPRDPISRFFMRATAICQLQAGSSAQRHGGPLDHSSTASSTTPGYSIPSSSPASGTKRRRDSSEEGAIARPAKRAIEEWRSFDSSEDPSLQDRPDIPWRILGFSRETTAASLANPGTRTFETQGFMTSLDQNVDQGSYASSSSPGGRTAFDTEHCTWVQFPSPPSHRREIMAIPPPAEPGGVDPEVLDLPRRSLRTLRRSQAGCFTQTPDRKGKKRARDFEGDEDEDCGRSSKKPRK